MTKQRKRNIQIQMIFMAVAIILAIIVLGSSYKLPKAWIRILSYIWFITLIELILYVVIYGLHSFTNGEPVRILGIKVLLIVLITPFHHKIEKLMVRVFTKRQVGKVLWEKSKML